jgi:hypothetical protein
MTTKLSLRALTNSRGTARWWRAGSIGSLALLLACVSGAQAQVVLGNAFQFWNKTTTACKLTYGTGSPEGARTGNPCDTYWRTDPPTVLDSVLWEKRSGAGTTTGWVAVGSSAGTGVYVNQVNTWLEATAAPVEVRR